MPQGSVLALLGPNGAGKTTLVRVLTTLIRPDHGRALVGGYDVVAEAAAVRRSIGLVGQHAAVDECLTGRENLALVAGLLRMGRAESRRQASAALETFGLTHVADVPAATYSGGLRRRLDIAVTLLAGPAVMFLDEPTTGLDPASRRDVWNLVERLVADGTTILLTTQYLEEADRLADSVAVIDHGRLIATGTPDDLRPASGATRCRSASRRHPGHELLSSDTAGRDCVVAGIRLIDAGWGGAGESRNCPGERPDGGAQLGDVAAQLDVVEPAYIKVGVHVRVVAVVRVDGWPVVGHSSMPGSGPVSTCRSGATSAGGCSRATLEAWMSAKGGVEFVLDAVGVAVGRVLGAVVDAVAVGVGSVLGDIGDAGSAPGVSLSLQGVAQHGRR